LLFPGDETQERKNNTVNNKNIRRIESLVKISRRQTAAGIVVTVSLVLR
jgi:hypothetical protein